MKTVKSRIYNSQSLIDLGVNLNDIKKKLINTCLTELKEIETPFKSECNFHLGRTSDERDFIECVMTINKY